MPSAAAKELRQSKREIQSVSKAMAAEIIRARRASCVAPAPQYSGNYNELVVQKGDTLSGISSLAGVVEH